MRTSSMFQPDDAHIDALVRAHPLATLVSPEADGMLATPLPLILERRDSTLTLFGHFARSNPHLDAIRAEPHALAIFLGPQGYISPSWFDDRSQAPTWNFATAHFDVHVQLLDGEEASTESVETLTRAMEQGRPRAWAPHELGPRHAQLIPHIVAFRATVLRTRVKFKLGQNERVDVLAQAIAGVSQAGQTELASMMQQANANRL